MNIIKKIRQQKDLTQLQLSELSGIPQPWLSRYENNTPISEGHKRPLASVLEIPTDMLENTGTPFLTLVRLRKAHQMSLSELARRCRTSTWVVRQWELGKPIGPDHRQALGQIFHMHSDTFINADSDDVTHLINAITVDLHGLSKSQLRRVLKIVRTRKKPLDHVNAIT